MRHEILLSASLLVGHFHAIGAAQQASLPLGEVRKHAENAKAALARNDLVSAEREYRVILQLDPADADVYTALGVALYGSGRFAESIAALSKALELEKNQPRAELFRALSESSLGHCERAIPVLSQGFPDQRDSKLQRLVGLSLLDCQSSGSDPSQAFDTVRTLHDSFPDDPDVLYKSAELYTRLWDRAAGELMQKHPESYRVHQLAGEVLEAQEKNDQATKEFRLALEENPRVPELHLRIGQLILKQSVDNAEENALAEFRKELAVNPQSASAEYAMGEVYRNRRDFQPSREHFQRAIELDAQFAEPHVGLGQLFLSQRDSGKAREQLEAAIRLQPDNAAAHYNLMLVYRREGDTEAASREMATFQKLQRQDEAGFQAKLHSLLTGTGESASHAK